MAKIADNLRIKLDFVYKWIAEKQMPERQMGRFWEFRKEEVDKWVKSGGVGERKMKAGASHRK